MDARGLETLNALVDEYLDCGLPLPYTAIAYLVCVDPSESDAQAVRRQLIELAKAGFVEQLYHRGPWRPLRDSDGLSIKTRVTLEGP